MDYFTGMQISVSAAKAQLTELVRRAEAGDEVILTRHGHPAVRLTPVNATAKDHNLRDLLEEIRANAKPTQGPCAARSQDFLYDEYGVPK